MKKTLLMIAACGVLTAAQAQTDVAVWSDAFTTVAATEDVNYKAPVAVAADGSTYVTGNFTQAFAFGTTFLENIANSAYLAKYNAAGEKQWAVALKGAATIKAIDTDANGNVYIAGVFADVVEMGSTGETETINGMADETEQVSGFIAAYNADGQLLKVKTIIPETDADVLASGVYIPMSGEVYFTINHLEISGTTLYVSAKYTGDVTVDGMEWEGEYLDLIGLMYSDLPSNGIMALNAETLDGARSILRVATANSLSGNQMGSETLNFTVDGDDVYASFIGYGSLKVTTADKEETFDLSYVEGTNEHAAFITAIRNGETTINVYRATPHDKTASWNNVVAMQVENNKLYVGGTFIGSLGFKPEMTETGSADMFVACVNTADLTVDWVAQSNLDEGDANQFTETATAMRVRDGKAYITGYTEDFGEHVIQTPVTFNVTDAGFVAAAGKLVTGVDANSDLWVLAGVDGLETTYAAYKTADFTAIDNVQASKDITRSGDIFTLATVGKVRVYDMQGRVVIATEPVNTVSVAALPKGVYILSSVDGVLKFVK